MAGKKAEAQPEPVEADKNGFVTITNGDMEAKVVASSVPAWVGQGWKAKPPEPGERLADNKEG